MQLVDLREQVRLGMSARNDLTSSVLNSWINSALKQICFAHGFKEMETSSSSTVPGRVDFTLPSDVSRINGFMYQDSSEAWFLPWFTKSRVYEEFPEMDISPESGEPEVFYYMAGKVYVYPYPTSGNYKLFYFKKHATLVEDDDTPSIDADEAVIYKAQEIGMNRLQFAKEQIDRVLYLYTQNFNEAVKQDNEFWAGQDVQLGAYKSRRASRNSDRFNPLVRSVR